MPISNELFSALEKGGALATEKQDAPAAKGGGNSTLFDRLLMQESGGRQFDKNGSVITSNKGALGIAQIMPTTGPEAARLAGLEWNPERLKTDPEYNRRLGQAYLEDELRRFGGDERMALAAYNGGRGAVARAAVRARREGGDFLDYMPLETQKYVPAILGESSAKPKGKQVNWMDERTIPRDDGRMGAQRKSEAVREGITAGDLTKAFGASALSGLGDMAQGLIGEPLAWLANKAAGTEEFEGKNLLSGIADSVREGMTEGGKLAREDVPAGDVFQPDTWKLPETTGGMLMIGADGLGSLIPSILPFVGQAGKAASLSKAAKAAELAGDVAKASELAMQAERASRIAKGAGAAGGFGMTGGAAASDVRKNVEQELQGRSHEDLVASVPLYRDAFEKTGDAKMARQAVVNGAAQYATLFSGAMGAVGGGVNAKLLEDVIVKRGVSAALGRASGNRAVRSAVGAGAGAVGEGLQEVSEKVGQNAGENMGLGRPSTESVTRDSFGDFVGGAMVGGPMGAGGGGISPRVSKPIATPVQPTIEANSPLSNMASIGQAEAANAAQAAGTPQVDATAQGGEAGASSDPIATRLAAMQSFVEDKAFIQALRGTQGYGPESVTEMLSAFAKARNPNIDPMVRERALSDLERFIQGFNNRPNFVFGQDTQERPNPPGQQVVPVSPDGGAVSRPIRRDDGRTLDGEIITRPDRMAGANPNQLSAPPVLGLPTEEALAAKRQADADYDQAFQDMLKAEQLGATEAELAEYQRTIMEAERLRNELAAQISDTDARVSDAQRREAEARRREILARVIEEGISGVNPVADVSSRFAAELRRQGYQNADPTEAEAQSILRAVDVANAREDGPLPSLPNEADFYEPPKPPRATAPKAEPKQKQQPARKLTPLEIRKYIAAGAVLNGDTLTLPDGTTIKLKGPQIAAAREAIRKASPAQVEAEPVEASDSVVSEQEADPQEVETADAASESEPKPEIRNAIDAAAHEAATSPLNDTPQPTDAQKESGNYKVGRVRIQGMDISIENPRGSVRSGTSPDGTAWSNTLHSHYGYLVGTKAADGDNLDVYLTDGAEDAPMVWVIDQKNTDGSFDEHKALIGPLTEDEARDAYLANYTPGWDGIGAISSMPVDAFKAWAYDGKKKRKPLVYVEPEAKPAAPQLPSKPVALVNRVHLHYDDLLAMSADAGWAERGGALLRDTQGNAVGRTKWIPRSEWFVAGMEPDPEVIRTAIERIADGNFVIAKSRRTVEGMLDWLESKKDSTAAEEDRSAYDHDPDGYLEVGTPAADFYDSFDDLLAGSPLTGDEAMRSLGFTEEEINEAANAGRSVASRQGEARQAQSNSAETGNQADRPGDDTQGPALESYTEQDLAERAEAQRLAEEVRAKADREADNKARADAERDTFTLTGSDRPADVMATMGQGGLFDAPASSDNQNPIKSEAPASAEESAEAAAQDQESIKKTDGERLSSQEWRDRGKTPEDLRREKVDDLGRELARTVLEESKNQDFAPNDLPKVVAYWAQDAKIQESELASALLGHLKDFDFSEGRLNQIRKALGVNPAPAVSLDTEAIFTGLASRGLAKTRAKQAAASHPQAEQIAYVQENFHDILIQLMDAGKLEVNGSKTVTEDNKTCL